VAEALEIARDVEKKLLEAQRERGDLSSFQPASERPEFAIAVGD
jgi:hypothetical protein